MRDQQLVQIGVRPDHGQACDRRGEGQLVELRAKFSLTPEERIDFRRIAGAAVSESDPNRLQSLRRQMPA